MAVASGCHVINPICHLLSRWSPPLWNHWEVFTAIFYLYLSAVCYSWTEAISAHLDWRQNPANMMKGSDLHPKDHSIPLFTDALNEGWCAHLEQSSTKGLWSPQEKRLHINVLELKAVSLALRHFKDQCQDQTVLVATDN